MHVPSDAAQRHCRNCGSVLAGPYCASCGQSAHHTARSFSTLFHDAWHDLTHLDGRLWRTLGALAFRPGLLTSEYLDDRRARYLPPFRLYLVLSLLFFALEAAGAGAARRDVVVRPRAAGGGAAPGWELAVRELEPSGERAGAATPPGAEVRAADPADLDRACSWLASTGGERLGRVLVASCKHAIADGGRALQHAFLANLPKTFFLFLPLVALVLFALFGRTRRYYVEHLVVVLHLQAAMFLLGSVSVGVHAAERWGGAGRVPGALTTAALWGYGGWYTYRSLRGVYAEGRAATVAKLAVLGFAYLILLALTLAGTVLVSAYYA